MKIKQTIVRSVIRKRLLLTIMKTFIFLLCTTVFAFNTENTFSQEKVTISEDQFTTVDQVFRIIKKQTNYRFLYPNNLFKKAPKIHLQKGDILVADLLKKSLSSRNFDFEVSTNNTIIIKESSEALGSNSVNSAKVQEVITGTILDMAGIPLPGANIVEKGTTNGIQSDFDGNFSISLEKPNAVLVVSYIGYATKEINVSGQTNLKITLEEDAAGLDEVVVVGYGTQKRSDITGAVVSVPKDRLENLPVTNVLHAIQGTTAGLNISQQSSVPGSSASVQVRGVNSINANTSPLIVLDGVPFFGTTNDINPNDIKSIEILKDASAVAIYGTRGSNGVILITSKRGNKGDSKPVVRYSGYVGLEAISNPLTPMNADDYVQKYADFLSQNNQAQTAILPNSSEVENYDAGVTTDWLKEATQSGQIQEHNLSIAGGAEKFQYYFSGSKLSQDGVVKGYKYEKTNFRVNLDSQVTDFLKIGTSSFFTHNNYDGGRANLLNATAMSPYSLPRDENGQTIIFPMAPELLFSNPLLGLETDRLNRNKNLTGTGYAELNIIEGLTYRLNGSYTYNLNNFASYSGRAANDQNGTANVSNEETSNWVVENIVNYSKDINKHHFDVTALYSAQKVDFFRSESKAVGFINDAVSYNNLSAGKTQSNDSRSNSYSLLSQMGRLNYGYDSRYLLTVTARRDGYSAFGSNTSKYGIFPSVALGWNIKNESFLEESNFVTNLKLRLSHGQTGNQAIAPNQTATVAGTVQQPLSGNAETGILFNTLGNANLNWETTTSSNIGLDFSLLSNRISGSFEVYKSKTEDILLQRSIPTISGYNQIWANLGAMQNKGLEITLSTVNIRNDNFSWTTDINFATYENEILELYGDGKDDIGNRWFIGQPLNIAFDYKKVGIWQEGDEAEIAITDPVAKPGDIKFEDYDGDEKITSEDRQILGRTDPKWTGGLTNTFKYKNFNLSVFIQTSQGGLKSNRDLTYADEAWRRNLPAGFGYWTAENKDNYWPSLAAYTNYKGYGFWEDNSYIRIKDVRFSYQFPKEVLGEYIQGLTLYASGRNLHTFTNWFGWDPENNYQSRGSSNWENNYPVVRTISFGVNMTL